jgi:hypothetical protein
MSDWSRLIEKAAQVAKEEGLLGDDLKKEILPRAPRVEVKSQVMAIVKSVVEENTSLEAIPERNEKPEKATGLPTERTGIAREEALSKANHIIQEQVDLLEEWSKANLAEAQKDWRRFWLFKIPALISSVSVTAFEAFGYGNVVIILGVVSALCIGIDAAFPGGQLHNVHKRAASESRRLQHDVVTRWRQVQFDETRSVSSAVNAILDEIKRERTRIDKYVTDAETSLGSNQASEK